MIDSLSGSGIVPEPWITASPLAPDIHGNSGTGGSMEDFAK